MDKHGSIHIPVRTCKKHRFEDLVVYCKDCLAFLCYICAREDHLSHDCEGISKFSRDVRSQIPNFCKEVKEKLLTSMREDLEKLETTKQENEEKYENQKGQLKTLQKQNT